MYCSAYSHLLKNIFVFWAMARGEHASEGKREPSHKCTAIDSEMKIRVIHKYKGG
jgi:hypothetical protein